MPIDPSLFDDKKLQEEEDSARADKAKYATLGAIGDNLANRQSFGNFFLGHMNPHQDGSSVAKAIGDSIEDPVARQKQLLERYQSKMAAQKADLEEKDALESRDPLSEKSKTAQGFLKGLDPKLAASMANLSDAQIQENFKNPAFVGYMQQQRDMAKLDQEHKNRLGEIYAQNSSKVPKGFQKTIDPVTGEETLTAIAKTLPASEAVTIGDANASFDALGDVSGMVRDNPKMFGPAVGLKDKLAAWTGIGETGRNASTVNATLKQRAQVIGKYLEGGKLTDSDIKRYEESLPQFGDQPEVAQNKIASLQRLLVQKQGSDVAALKQAGYGTDGLRTSAMPALPHTSRAVGNAGEAMAGQGSGEITPHDVEALKWVRANPKDPRAADVVSQLKQKGINP